MTRRNRWFLIIGLVVLAGGFGAYRLTRHETPKTQPPLAYLNDATLTALREDFNRNADSARVIVLLSPT